MGRLGITSSPRQSLSCCKGADVSRDTTVAHGPCSPAGVAQPIFAGLIRARTTEGRARAKLKGRSLGRRPKLTSF